MNNSGGTIGLIVGVIAGIALGIFVLIKTGLL